MTIKNIRALLSRVSCGLLGTEFTLLVEYDKKYTKFNGGVQPPEGRIYIQVQYQAPCTKTGVHNTWKGGKYYLSSHMTPDEIVKKAYVAFEAAVKHEIMEGFKVDGKILFNPHAHFEALLEVSDREVKRETEVRVEDPVMTGGSADGLALGKGPSVTLVHTRDYPHFYSRGREMTGNFYSDDSHPNDKKYSHKAGQPKRRAIGLEEAGWTGYSPTTPLSLDELYGVLHGTVPYRIEHSFEEIRPNIVVSTLGKRPPSKCLHMNLAISHNRFKNSTSQICQDCGEETIIQR